MSYMRNGLSFSGLGAAFTVDLRSGDAGIRGVQQELSRLGFLESDESAFGIDGKWGPRTESAIRSAARYVGYSGTPYRRSGSTVTIPDELLALLRLASPAPPGTTGRVSTVTPVTPAPETTTEAPPPVEEPWRGRTIVGLSLMSIASGIGILALAGVALYAMTRPEESRTSRTSTPMALRTTLAANRRRRRK